jgi:hypothetical protein
VANNGGWFTTDKPLPDGYYWWRLEMMMDHWDAPRTSNGVAYVRGGYWASAGSGMEEDDFTDYEWYGPIPCPLEDNTR